MDMLGQQEAMYQQALKRSRKDELYEIAFELERFASSGLKENAQKELRGLVDRIRWVAAQVE